MLAELGSGVTGIAGQNLEAWRTYGPRAMATRVSTGGARCYGKSVINWRNKGPGNSGHAQNVLKIWWPGCTLGRQFWSNLIVNLL